MAELTILVLQDNMSHQQLLTYLKQAQQYAVQALDFFGAPVYNEEGMQMMLQKQGYGKYLGCCRDMRGMEVVPFEKLVTLGHATVYLLE